MFSLICAWINGSINNDEPGDLRRHCAHYDVTVMFSITPIQKMNYFNESLETIPPCIYKHARLARAVLVTKFEKHPLFPFRWFRTKKHSFINRNRCSIKTLLFEAKRAFSLYKIKYPFCGNDNNCIKLKIFFSVDFTSHFSLLLILNKTPYEFWARRRNIHPRGSDYFPCTRIKSCSANPCQ